jgi:thiol-disulfide isomerase/thioredoxin
MLFNQFILTLNLVLLLLVLLIIYYLIKYNSNFLKQIQSIKEFNLDTLEIGQKAPAFRTFGMKGEKVVSKQIFQKQKTLILFVNSSCPKCKSLVQNLDSIYKNYALNFLVINTDEIYDDSGIINTLPDGITYIRSSHISMTYFVHVTPTAMIISKEGVIELNSKIHKIQELINLLISQERKVS